LLVFGPVPSRRLGRSLGINNIPPKACSYSCVYCQVGTTRVPEIVPREFYAPDRICQEVETRLAQIRETGSHVDYLTFVPDGEPTLDALLGESIERLRPLGIPVAVISNASLLWHKAVREALMKADWVSLKVDAIAEPLWRRINRPHASLDHAAILDGMAVFAGGFSGTLATESMIVRGLNDDEPTARDLAGFLGKLGPDVAYLSVPTRPPAEKHVHTPDEAALNRIYQIVSRQVNKLELLTGYEGDAFASTGNVVEDLLSITSVHPLREAAVRRLLDKTGSHWQVVERLIADEQLKETSYEGKKFYVRRISGKSG
jgi:wyosine [tRNA(Phe)-imidazoG37] synthetase (radical SAM superfamily)